MYMPQTECPKILVGDFAKQVIETTRLTLQPLSMRYLSDIFTGYTPAVAKNMYSQPGSIEDTSKSIIECFGKIESNQGLYFTIVSNETMRCLGCAGIRILADRVVFPRFWLRQDVWFKRYGLEVMRALMYFIEENLPCDQVYVSINKDNIAAKVVLEKVGGVTQNHWYTHENAHGEENLLTSYRIFFKEN